MRRLTWILLMAFVFTLASIAQTTDLMLDWDSALNTITGSVDLRGTANIPDQQFFYVEAAQYDPSMAEIDLWTPVVLPPVTTIVDDVIGALAYIGLPRWFVSSAASCYQQRAGKLLLCSGADSDQQRWRHDQQRTGRSNRKYRHDGSRRRNSRRRQRGSANGSGAASGKPLAYTQSAGTSCIFSMRPSRP